MADQRRRGGRGRSGRGGKIPRKGDQQSSAANDEAFVSFPLDVTGPIRVPGTLGEAEVEATLRDTLARERKQSAALAALEQRTGETALAGIRAEAGRHREALEQLAKELGAEIGGPDDAAGGDETTSLTEAVGAQAILRLGWFKLQTAAYAAGDKRIDRVVKPVLREKERHSLLLEELGASAACRSLFPDPEY
jgi:hypothetical protein